MAQLYGLVFVQDYPLKVGGLLLLIYNQSVPYPMYSGHHSLRPVAVSVVGPCVDCGPLPQDSAGH